MVGVRPTTLVGHPRTNHQSVMEHGGVRPAHLVGHPSLRSRQGNPDGEYQAGVVRGRHSITAMGAPIDEDVLRAGAETAGIEPEFPAYWFYGKLELSFAPGNPERCPTRVVGRTPT